MNYGFLVHMQVSLQKEKSEPKCYIALNFTKGNMWVWFGLPSP